MGEGLVQEHLFYIWKLSDFKVLFRNLLNGWKGSDRYKIAKGGVF